MISPYKLARILRPFIGDRLIYIAKSFYYFIGNLISNLFFVFGKSKILVSKDFYKPKVINISRKFHSHFGYFDKSSVSNCGNYLIDICFKKNDDKAFIDIYNLAKNNFDKPIISIPTSAHNYQQSSMVNWISSDNDSFSIIYNDIANSYLFSNLLFYSKKQKKFKIKRFHYPIQSISINNIALSIDYKKLKEKRKEYSYSTEFEQSKIFDKYLFFEFSLNNEKIIRGFEIKDIPTVYSSNFKKIGLANLDEILYNFNHALYSPNGLSFVILLRVYDKKGNRLSNLLFIDESKKVRLLFSGIISHYCFISDYSLFVWGKPIQSNDFSKPCYFIFDIKTEKFNIVHKLIDFHDGHPTYDKNSNNLVFDTYPDFYRFSELWRFSLDSQNLKRILSVYHPLKYNADKRIDLHPRFSKDGKKLTFDSCCRNMRKQFIMDL